MALISLRHISKSYTFAGGTIQALTDINLDINNGEFLVIMGPSGSGKSTLLNILAGLDRPTSGEFSYNGKDMQKASSAMLALYRQKIVGIVFQSFNLITTLSTKENIKMPRLLAANLQKSAETDTDALLKELDILDKRNFAPNRLSGGQQQRVTIARALINNPEVILADEPTGNLDSVTSTTIIEILKKINEEKKKTVIVITHNPDLTQYADRVVYMRDGAIEKIEDRTQKQEIAQSVITLEGNPGKLSIKSNIGIALANLKRTRMRTFLTSFGVAIGIAALILLVSFASAIENSVISSLTSVMSLKQITVTTRSANSGGVSLFGSGNSAVQGQSTPVTSQTISQIQKINHVSSAYALNRYLGTMTYNGKQTSIFSANSAPVKYIDTSIEDVKSGRLFTSDTEKSIILTDSIAKTFGITDAKALIGKTVSVNISLFSVTPDATPAKPFIGDLKVVGVSSLGGISSYPIIPYNLYQPTGSNITYSQLVVNADSQDNVQSVKDAIDKLGYSATSAADVIGTIQKTFVVLKAVFGLIGAIALVVACLGIINVMLISVLERFKEIGIMKAVGARPLDIRRLFITEAAVIGFIGGVFGIALGWISGLIINVGVNTFITSRGGDKSNLFSVSPYLILLSLALAIIISMVASIYPASKASNLNPIEALRRE